MYSRVIQSVILLFTVMSSSSAYIASVQSTSGHYAKVGYNYNITFNTLDCEHLALALPNIRVLTHYSAL